MATLTKAPFAKERVVVPVKGKSSRRVETMQKSSKPVHASSSSSSFTTIANQTLDHPSHATRTTTTTTTTNLPPAIKAAGGTHVMFIDLTKEEEGGGGDDDIDKKNGTTLTTPTSNSTEEPSENNNDDDNKINVGSFRAERQGEKQEDQLPATIITMDTTTAAAVGIAPAAPKATDMLRHESSPSNDNGLPKVGSRISVWWDFDQVYFHGTIVKHIHPKKRKQKEHILTTIHYDDGDIQTLNLNNTKYKWHLLPSINEDDPTLFCHTVGTHVRKYFAGCGWYNGTIISIINKSKNDNSTSTTCSYVVQYSDGEKEQFDQTSKQLLMMIQEAKPGGVAALFSSSSSTTTTTTTRRAHSGTNNNNTNNNKKKSNIISPVCQPSGTLGEAAVARKVEDNNYPQDDNPGETTCRGSNSQSNDVQPLRSSNQEESSPKRRACNTKTSPVSTSKSVAQQERQQGGSELKRRGGVKRTRSTRAVQENDEEGNDQEVHEQDEFQWLELIEYNENQRPSSAMLRKLANQVKQDFEKIFGDRNLPESKVFKDQMYIPRDENADGFPHQMFDKLIGAYKPNWDQLLKRNKTHNALASLADDIENCFPEQLEFYNETSALGHFLQVILTIVQDMVKMKDQTLAHTTAAAREYSHFAFEATEEATLAAFSAHLQQVCKSVQFFFPHNDIFNNLVRTCLSSYYSYVSRFPLPFCV